MRPRGAKASSGARASTLNAVALNSRRRSHFDRNAVMSIGSAVDAKEGGEEGLCGRDAMAVVLYGIVVHIVNEGWMGFRIIEYVFRLRGVVWLRSG